MLYRLSHQGSQISFIPKPGCSHYALSLGVEGLKTRQLRIREVLWPAEGYTAVTPEISFQGSWSHFGHNWLHSPNLEGSTSYPWSVSRELNSLKAQIKCHLVQDQKETAQRGQKPPYFLPVSLGTCSIYPEATGRIILGVWNSPKDDYSLQGDIIDTWISQSTHRQDNLWVQKRGRSGTVRTVWRVGPG